MLVVTGEAAAHYKTQHFSNYTQKRAEFEYREDHARDVIRFFDNHPRLARTHAGKIALRSHKQLLRWSDRELESIQRYVYSGRFLPARWFHITTCESGSNPPNWKHNSGTYQGAFGFHYTSWDNFNTFGYPSEAYLATPEQQYRVALAIYARYGFTGWGCA